MHVVHGNALLLVLAKGGAQVPLSTAGSRAGDDATQIIATQRADVHTVVEVMSTQMVDVHTVHTVVELMFTQLTTRRVGVHTVVEVMSTQRWGRVAAGGRLGGCDHRLARRLRITSRHW